jgi:hypothetical protein
VQNPYPLKDAESWGTFVRYIEFGDDGFALRQVDEYENGNLCRYDRSHWDDQFGTLANFRFGPLWIQHWGTPLVITAQEFEDKWAKAGVSPVLDIRNPPPRDPPPWIRA